MLPVQTAGHIPAPEMPDRDLHPEKFQPLCCKINMPVHRRSLPQTPDIPRSSPPALQMASAGQCWNPSPDTHNGLNISHRSMPASLPCPYRRTDRCNSWTDDSIFCGNQEMPRMSAPESLSGLRRTHGNMAYPGTVPA